MRVLVVEDYVPLRRAVVQGLEEAGFAVDATGDGQEALWYATDDTYDVIVLDLMLPGIDGLTLLKRMREAGNKTHVLILTAKDTLDDRLRGLNLGADDYLTKPFAFEELLARIRALVRRKYDAKDPLIHVGDLEIDTVRRIVHRGEQAIELTAREYALLEFLALRAGSLVTRTDIWEHVYEFHSSPESNVVDVYIGYLRKKIEHPGQPRLIHTRRGQGYVLGETG
jgi:two-component system, OmpR family, copper resistance phosphate regulon response regulator CusR